MNDTIPDPGDQTVPAPNADKTVPAHSVPPVSSGMYGHGSHLLQSGMMLPALRNAHRPRVALPGGLIRLGDYAFDTCTGLTHLEIPSTVTDTGNFTFNRCYGLTRITIPPSVTRIGDYAFTHCTSLPTITIPDSVTSIGARAFNYCSGLTHITIPASVTSIGGKCPCRTGWLPGP